MDRITSILDLKADLHTFSNWADSTFSCIYHLDEGDLVVSVKEAKVQAAALSYFDAIQALAIDARPIDGLANLAFPGRDAREPAAAGQETRRETKQRAGRSEGGYPPPCERCCR